MQMILNQGFWSFTLDLANEKFDVWTTPLDTTRKNHLNPSIQADFEIYVQG